MASVRSDPAKTDRKGVEEMLMTDPAIKKAVRAEADRIANRARELAPYVTGEYHDSIDVVEVVTSDMRMNRQIARVVARAPHAGKVEALHGTLSRAIGR